jgi:hypothetical protein
VAAKRSRRCPRDLGDLSGGPFGSKALPWDIISIVSVKYFWPAVGVWAGGCACAAGAAGSIKPGGGTNATAKTRPAGNWCVVGRPRSGSNNGVSSRKFAKHMRQPSGNGVPGVPQALVASWQTPTRNHLGSRSRSRIRARGHAAEKEFLPLFAIGRAAMTRYAPPAVAMLAIAAMVVAKPSTACAIANASGWSAISQRKTRPLTGSRRPSNRGGPTRDSRRRDSPERSRQNPTASVFNYGRLAAAGLSSGDLKEGPG